ncbi:CUB domain-containing protein [Methanosarcina mazei]|uniref:CUB domain-containing protein n=1 Tax=Methanosarcina mazei TaxID=2209 RepID=A0A0F8FEY7_METMZ|nr:hypothetical protein [Methanosarcina mazei]KKG28507.1 hypothetical protein DU49_07090 [Methanosarcina mazei]KKG40835.1 hypothetical protein DU35_06460 [Methanosarcina mazei]KKG45585.1 hypothetical protein DU39_07835 [Methanosarcina mazei]KKG46790.1 hypothetical protein DU41_05425 [Methanosarcina mazei]KKG49757.1 hypothetical protein DU38_07930 [Methanosarcina mazei]
MSRIYVLKIVFCCLLLLINGCISASSSESLPESNHPYSNNFEYTWPDISESGANQIRFHFENLELAASDKLILCDKYDNVLVTYDRWDSRKNFWTEWYTGDSLKVKLITDDSYTAYGFKIDQVENRLDVCPSDDALAESYHPYANNFEHKWPDISKPSSTQIRLHFENLELAASDKLILYDKYDNKLVTYDRWDSGKDFWTEWYTGDIIKVKLVTDNSYTAYGFKIDNVEGRSDMWISDNALAESYHPYANNFEYIWPGINKLGGTQIRLHFENLELAASDKLILYDKYDNKLVTYDRWDSSKDFWTEWYTGDIIKVKLVTDNSGTDYGFKIDKGEIKNENNITTVFTESTKTLDPINKKIGDKSGEDTENLQNLTDSDYIHNQFVQIAVTLNILEEEDKDSWMYKNIQWIFSGIGVFFLGGISGLVKKLRDKKSKDETLENK